MKLFSVPNLFSLGNLLCGCIATLNVIEGNLYPAAFLVGIASVFDFLDGFAARGLKQGSPMGKELDSLADMVTFGVVPGMVLFQLIRFALAVRPMHAGFVEAYLPYIGFVVPLLSGLRLAKFNVDTKQSESFIGLPTLANAIFVTGLPLLLNVNTSVFNSALSAPTSWMAATGEAAFLQSPVLLMVITIVMSFLLISPLPMFSFKVKNVKWKGNEIRYIFLLLSAGLVVLLRMKALPAIIVLYILLSVIHVFFSGAGKKEI